MHSTAPDTTTHASDPGAPTLFIPCPVEEQGYAGWMFQIRRIADGIAMHRAPRLLFKFHDTNGGHVRQSIAFARSARSQIMRASRGAVILFPVFYLPNMLLALLLPRSIPYVVRISGNELEPGNRLSFALRKFLLRRARSVIVLNRDSLETLTHLGIRKDRQVFIPNGVSDAFRPPRHDERAAARQLFGLGDDRLAIGTVGTVCRRKRQHVLVEAVASLGRENVTLLLCGPEEGHPEADPDYAEYCRALAARKGVHLIMTGRIEDVRGLLWALDIFVLPSEHEGMPNSLLEAMACGLPSIATDIAGSRDIIEHTRSGFLFVLDDTSELTGLVEMLASHEQQRVALSDRTRDRIAQCFSSTLTHESYARVIESAAIGRSV